MKEIKVGCNKWNEIKASTQQVKLTKKAYNRWEKFFKLSRNLN